MAKRTEIPKQSIRLKDRVENFLNSNLTAIKRIPPADICNLFEDLQIYQTEIENHRKDMQESEERFRTITNTAVDSIFLKNINRQYTFVNPSMVQLMGCTEADLIGKVPEEVFDKEDAAIVNKVDQRTLSGENVSEVRSLTIAGKPYTFHTIQVPLHDSDGNIKGISGIVRDITVFRQAEEKLRKSEKKYKLLAENVTDVIYVVSLDKLKIEYVSPSIKSILGYTVEEFMDSNIYDLLLPYSADLVMEKITQELEKDKHGKAEPQLLELEIIRKDGLKICVGVSARFLRGNEGHVTSILCVARDISKRKKVEEALKGSEEKYRFLADNVTDMIWTMDMNFNYTYVSPSITRMLGFTVEEGLARTAEESITPASFNNAMKVLAEELELITKGQASLDRSIKIENELYCIDGSTVLTEAEVSFIYDSKGQPMGVIGATRDITERKEAEETIQKSEEMYRLLANNATDVIWTMDMEMNFTYVSPSVIYLQGFTAEEALVMSPEMLMTPDSFKKVVKSMAEELEMHKKGQKPIERSRTEELELYRKDGSKVWAESEGNFLYDSSGQPEGVIGINRNITERKNAEEKLLRAKNSLEEKVNERTAEIQEKNTALKVLLNQRGEDKKNLEESIMSNVKELLIPNINRLKSSTLTTKQQTALNILESNLNEIISPFANSTSSIFMKLTPTEIQVANFIKHGSSSKDIAESLSLSQRTVDTHRYNIRKKLGVRGKGINLRTYLLSIT